MKKIFKRKIVLLVTVFVEAFFIVSCYQNVDTDERILKLENSNMPQQLNITSKNNAIDNNYDPMKFHYNKKSAGWFSRDNYISDQVNDRFVSGDFNGDGKEDVAAFYDYGGSNSKIHVWLSNGEKFNYQSSNGWWSSAGYPLGGVQNRIVSGDFNGDGSDDIATIFNYGRGQIRFHVWVSIETTNGWMFQYNKRSAGWSIKENYSLDKIDNRIVCGDFDGDGDDDIAALYEVDNINSKIHVWLSNKDGFDYQSDDGWWSKKNYCASSVGNRIVCGDFDGDGDDDIATFYDYITEIRIHVFIADSEEHKFIYQGTNGFHASYGWDVRSGYQASQMDRRITSGDFNGDGKDDIAVFSSKKNAEEANIHIWSSIGDSFIYQGDNGWWSHSGYKVSQINNRFIAGDFNNDGKADLASMYKYGPSSTRIHVWTPTFAKEYLLYTSAFAIKSNKPEVWINDWDWEEFFPNYTYTGSDKDEKEKAEKEKAEKEKAEQERIIKNAKGVNNYAHFGYCKFKPDGFGFIAYYEYDAKKNLAPYKSDIAHTNMKHEELDYVTNEVQNNVTNRNFLMPCHSSYEEKIVTWYWDSKDRNLNINLDGFIHEWKEDNENRDICLFKLERSFYNQDTLKSTFSNDGIEILEYKHPKGFAHITNNLKPREEYNFKHVKFIKNFKKMESYRQERKGNSFAEEKLDHFGPGDSGFGILSYESSYAVNLNGDQYEDLYMLSLTEPGNYKKSPENGFVHSALLLNYDKLSESIFYYNYGYDFNKNGVLDVPDYGHAKKFWCILNDQNEVEQFLFIEFTFQNRRYDSKGFIEPYAYPMINAGRYF